MRVAGISLGVLLVSLLYGCGGGSGDRSVTMGDSPQPLEATGGTTTDLADTGVTDTGNTNTDNMEMGNTDSISAETGIIDTGPAVYVTPEGVERCSVDDIKSRVDFDMRDYYIFYDQVPTLNLDSYDSGDALIQDLRVEPDVFSSVRDASTQTSLFEEGRKQGYGFWFQASSDGVVRFGNVDIGSPGFNAGIRRGDELITLNGQPVSEFSNIDLGQILGPNSVEAVTMSIRTGDEEPRTLSVSQQEYNWVTAAALNRFTEETNTSLPIIGYVSIQAFLATTQDEIDAALKRLEDMGGVDELIVDLRYNGGGLTSVASYLASVVGGAAVEGQVLLENRWNDKYAAFSNIELFKKVDGALNSPRVIVLTTGSTASSSEIFINSLKPYIEVVVIGDATAGKPFSSLPRTYCDKSINAMSVLRVNAAGVSVLGGIQPDCRIDDAWNTVAESIDDPLVKGALFYASQGTCPATTMADAGRLERKASTGLTFRPKELTNFAVGD